jgi:hypothetical protein
MCLARRCAPAALKTMLKPKCASVGLVLNANMTDQPMKWRVGG